MTRQDQLTYLAGCRLEGWRKVRLPSGAVLDAARFNVEYGGHTFERENAPPTSSAFAAFRELALAGNFT